MLKATTIWYYDIRSISLANVKEVKDGNSRKMGKEDEMAVMRRALVYYSERGGGRRGIVSVCERKSDM